MFALLLILSQALFLLLPPVRCDDELLLLSTGVRCETSAQCVAYFEREACKFSAHFCIDGACRAEPARVCERRGDATCNSRNHRCLIRLCHNASQCFRGELCDGEEHCIGGRCIFRYTGGLACTDEEEEEEKQQVVSIRTTPTEEPTAAPILVPPPHGTAAPTATPQVNVNLALIGVIVLAVVIGMVIFTLLIAAMSRTVVPYAIVNYDSQMIGGRTFLY